MMIKDDSLQWHPDGNILLRYLSAFCKNKLLRKQTRQGDHLHSRCQLDIA